MNISRRKFIRVASLSTLGALSVPLIIKGFDSIADAEGARINTEINENFQPDIDLELTALQKEVQLFDGQKTGVFSYGSRILKGGDRTVEELEDTYLGPIIRVKPGQKVRVRFKSQLPRESIIHWHGLHISPEMDGHPMYAIERGEQFVYEFTVNNRPGTYWFHPHPDKITGPQVYYGLAGMFIVEGEYPDLPTGKYDMPLILQDRQFDSDNQLVYPDNRMDRMRGFLGDRMLVNGRPEWHTRVKKATYRFRILNGSNSRIYKLAWSDGSEVVAIGTDGGLMERPVRKPYLMLSPGERVEIWKDFSVYDTDEEVLLKSLSFESGTSMGMGGRMGGGMMGGGAPQVPNGREFDLYSFTVSAQSGPSKSLPSRLSDPGSIDVSRAVNADRPRQFSFSFERMQWVINGETFGMKEVADWEKVRLNTTEIWEFINGGGGGMGMMGNMMQMPHPVHMHGLQFLIIQRDVSGVDRSAWQTVKDGFIDEGWQGTFLLLPGMRVQVAMRFEDYTGIYVYHCHNLEHEDMGMMRNYEVIE